MTGAGPDDGSTEFLAWLRRAGESGVGDAELFGFVLERLRARLGLSAARLELTDLAGGALTMPPGRTFDGGAAVVHPIASGQETVGRLELLPAEIGRVPSLNDDLRLALGIIGLLHMHRRRDRHYDAVKRNLRNARLRLERLEEKLRLRRRELWSTVLDLSALVAGDDPAPDAPLAGDALAGLVGASTAMQRLRIEIAHAARLAAPLLIEGEGGSGKSAVAAAIHALGPRSDRPLIVYACPETPIDRVEAELLGYEAGAFSGAARPSTGRLFAAHRGTLLLDEVGEIPPEHQVKLRQLVEARGHRPLGGEAEPARLDIHFLATTRVEVDRARAEGHLDDGLFFRLGVLRLRVPPLRERREDLPELIEHFLRQEERPLRIAPAVLEALQGHAWPGNVQELRNLVARWALLADGEVDERLLPPGLAGSRAAAVPFTPGTLRQREDQLIRQALAYTRGDQSEAARLLEINRATIWSKLKG